MGMKSQQKRKAIKNILIAFLFCILFAFWVRHQRLSKDDTYSKYKEYRFDPIECNEMANDILLTGSETTLFTKPYLFTPTWDIITLL